MTRLHPMLTVVITGVISSVIATSFFHIADSEIDPRLGSNGDFDPAFAATVALGFLGLTMTVGVTLFDEDASRTNWEANRAHYGHLLDRFTKIVRRPWHTVFAIGPTYGILAAAFVVTWRAFAKSPGESGTVWGDYLQSPLPALLVVLCCWILVTFALMWNGIVDACSRTSKPVSIAVFVVSFVVSLIGNPAFFAFALPRLPPFPSIVVCLLVLLLALSAQIATRRWAIAQARRFGYDRPLPPASPDQEEAPLLSLLRPVWAAPGGSAAFNSYPTTTAIGADPGRNLPPNDVIRPGERLLMWLSTDHTHKPHMLVATDRRFVQVAIIGPGRTLVLAQASPGTLIGATSHHQGPDVVTSAHFRDQRPMRIVGGDPISSARFAKALDHLAHTGRVPY